MIQLKTFCFNPLRVNTYVLTDGSGECIIVDAGCYGPAEEAELVSYIDGHNLSVKWIVNTHGHVDHALGAGFAGARFGAPIAGHPADGFLLESGPGHALMFGLRVDRIPPIAIELAHHDTLAFGQSRLRVIHTPGHSPGGICLYSEPDGVVLVGDTLFQGSIGRTDLPGGSHETLLASIAERLLTLPPAVRVHCGHGGPTTIGWEQANNPFLA